MARALYLTSVEPESGKSVVALGVMELLSRRVTDIGYFRPVVAGGPGPDETIELMRSRYRLDQTYEQSYGTTTDRIRGIGAPGRNPKLLESVMSRFDALAERCEVVVIEGTDFTGAEAAFEFALNTEMATNLGASALLVVPARDRAPAKVRGALAAARGRLGGRGVPLVGTVVNRAAPDAAEELRTALGGLPEPVWVLPEIPELDVPTLHEVARMTGADVLVGNAAQLGRDVGAVKVAAMGVAHFLDHLEPDTLVVVPGDRADIIMAALTARFTSAFPAPAGVLLTGGMRPDEAVLRFAAGLEGPAVPMLLVTEDTYSTASMLTGLRARITEASPRKIALALRWFDESVDPEELLGRIAVTEASVVTPLMFEHRLMEQARADRRRIVLPEGDDERVLRAAERLRDRDVVSLTVLGDPAVIADRARVLGLDLMGIDIIDPATDPLRERFAAQLYELRRAKGMSEETAYDLAGDVSYFGTMMVNEGLADGMVSGAAHTTADTVRPALQIIRTEPGTSVVSSVFFMALPDHVLVYGDCAVNPDPDAEALATIAISSARTAEAFGVDPFVAMLSYSTGSSGTGADVEKVRAATELVRQRAPELRVEGPIQYDAAVDAAVARSKLPGSEVAGHATVLIFPDLNTGNNTYKAVQRSAGAVAIGPVLQGLRKPVNDLSRGATIDDIVNTVVITAVQAQQVARRQAAGS